MDSKGHAMNALQPRYDRTEYAHRGQTMFEHSVQPLLTPADLGKFAAIDIESGAFELDRDDFTATQRLLDKRPDAQIWLVRVGQPAAYRIGGRPRSDRRP
jgi:hypothetical protein